MHESLSKALWYLCYACLLACIAFLPHYYHFSLSYVVGIAVIVAVIEHSLALFQKHVSLFFAKKFLTISVVLATVLIITALLLPQWWVIDKSKFEFYPIPIIQFLLQGFIVGISIRKLLLNMSLNNLFGESIEIQRLLFLSGIAIFLLLMPLDPRHGVFQCFYMFGFATGLFAHFLLRRFFLRGAKISRHGKLILGMINEGNKELSAEEKIAVKHFINRSWKKLERIYLKHLELAATKSLSPKLAIIESCMYRVRGEYDRALATIDKALESSNTNTYLEGLLFLQKALVLGEQGNDEEMYEALNESLGNNPKCFLTNVTYGLRLAEVIPLDRTAVDASIDIQNPLKLIREALHLNANERNSELLSNLIGHSVPLSWGFIQDAYGYALLKAGDYTFSKSLFLDCIKKEPSISSPYLHLGEWYFSYCLNRKPSRESLILADLCFSIALSIEGNKESRISRRAKLLAAEVKAHRLV